ncbi:MAG: PH domain-containing protein [Blastocatellia bacterium]
MNSQFCNRCGERVLAKSTQRLTPPPPMIRPARRRVRVEDRFENRYEEEEYLEEEYLDDGAEYENADYEEEDFEDEDDGDEREREVFRISPAFYGVGFRYLVAITLSVAATAIIGMVSVSLFSQFSFLTVLGIATLLMLNPIYHHIQHNRTVYTLTTVKLEIQTGLFAKTSRNIPLRHIQDVTVNQTLTDRLFSIGDVIIDSAVIEGTMPLRNINDPRKYADLILSELQYWN